MAKAKKEQAQKEKTLDLFDLRESKLLLKIKGTVEIEKIPVWDKTTRGNMIASYLKYTITTDKGVTTLISGCKNANMWLGKRLEEKEVSSEPQVLDI